MIQNASIEYRYAEGMYYWHLSEAGNKITIAYNDGNTDKEVGGKILISSSNTDKHAAPKAVVVYIELYQ